MSPTTDFDRAEKTDVRTHRLRAKDRIMDLSACLVDCDAEDCRQVHAIVADAVAVMKARKEFRELPRWQT